MAMANLEMADFMNLNELVTITIRLRFDVERPRSNPVLVTDA